MARLLVLIKQYVVYLTVFVTVSHGLLFRKDDYAFFLKPVDSTLIPGYAEAIKQPMDFGTMTTKLERGRYRSLEDFKVCPFIYPQHNSSPIRVHVICLHLRITMAERTEHLRTGGLLAGYHERSYI